MPDRDPHVAVTDVRRAQAFAIPEWRQDGLAKVTGRATYPADMRMPGMLWAAFATSPIPHGIIRSVDVSAARAMPGVHAVLTGQDTLGTYIGRRLMDRPVLCHDRVRFVGDRVAAVAAETRDQAEAAAAAVLVELERLPHVVDVQAAIRSDAPILHERPEEYPFVGGTRRPVAHPNIQGGKTRRSGDEDLDRVFASAARVYEHTFTTARTPHGFIEAKATLVWLDDGGRLHVATTHKAPFALRSQLSTSLGLPPEMIVIEAVDAIGGDFGGKGYAVDPAICYLLARRCGRPVKAVTRHGMDLVAGNVRHAAWMHLKTGVTADGRLLAHEARLLFDGGAYAGGKQAEDLSIAGGVATLAPYAIPHVRIELLTVYTNTVPGSPMRAPGLVQAAFAGESHLDAIARDRGDDPLQFRLRNVVSAGQPNSLGEVAREAKAGDVLEAAADAIGWPSPPRSGRGRGIAVTVRHVGAGALEMRLTIHPDGRLVVATGLVDQGGGSAEVIRRVLATTASVSAHRISIDRRSTDRAPSDPGVGGSRVTHLASRAAHDLGRRFVDWVDERLPLSVPDAASASIEDDHVVETGTGRRLASMDHVLATLVRPDETVVFDVVVDADSHDPGEPGHFDFAACAVELSVDHATGQVTIHDAVLAADVGTIINPLAHAGQVDGGFAFGVGAALMEELVVTEGLPVTARLGDVRIPSIVDVPRLRQVLVPTTIGPGAFGAKMVGELTNPPVAPAIANAIADAIGIRMFDLPMHRERVLAAIRTGEAREPEASGSA